MKCHESPSRWRSIKVGNNQARQLGAFSIMHLRRVCTESLTTTTTMHYEQRKKKKLPHSQRNKTAARPTNQRASPINSQTNSQTEVSMHCKHHSPPPRPSPGVRVIFSRSRRQEKRKRKQKAPLRIFVSLCRASLTLPCVGEPGIIPSAFVLQCSIR
jgi:septin family protein